MMDWLSLLTARHQIIWWLSGTMKFLRTGKVSKGMTDTLLL